MTDLEWEKYQNQLLKGRNSSYLFLDGVRVATYDFVVNDSLLGESRIRRTRSIAKLALFFGLTSFAGLAAMAINFLL